MGSYQIQKLCDGTLQGFGGGNAIAPLMKRVRAVDF